MKHRPQKKSDRATKKIEFGLLGIVLGMLLGTVGGLLLGLRTKPSLLLTQVMAVAGAMVGALGEAVRFWWRKKRRRRATQSRP